MSNEEGYSSGTFQNAAPDALFEIHTATKNSTALSVKDLDAGLKFATTPLMYWKASQFERPALAEIARKYLAVNATSVPSERLFSKCKRITNTTNSNLLPENVKINVLMNCWHNEIDGEY